MKRITRLPNGKARNQLKLLPKRKTAKGLFLLLILSFYQTITLKAQSPQWVLKQNTATNLDPMVVNYYNSYDEQPEDPNFIRQLTPAYNSPSGTTIKFGEIYGSYFYNDDFNSSPPSFTASGYPLFVIAEEASTGQIKAWSTVLQKTFGYTRPFSYIGSQNTNEPFFGSGLWGGRLALQPGDKPEFTIIPRAGVKGHYFAFTYIKTGSSTGSLIYFLIDQSTTSVGIFSGPYYLKDFGTLTNITSMPAEKGAIAIQKPSSARFQDLYLALPNNGIYRFQIDHYGDYGFNLLTNGSQSYLLNPLVSKTAGLGNWPVVNSTFATSELEISPDGQFLAWGDQTITNASVYTLSLNTNPRVVRTFSLPSSLSVKQVNGLEFNPYYSPGTVNTQLYVTAGRNGNAFSPISYIDGLFKIDVPGPGSHSVSSVGGSNSKYCAQTQLELDYNRNLMMIYSGSPSSQLQPYIPASSTTPSGSWGARKQYSASSISSSEIHRVPRQVDGWDYKFGGAITSGTSTPIVANGGCVNPPVIPNRTVTYTAATINPATVESVQYEWNIYRVNQQSVPYTRTHLVNDVGTSFQYTFPATPNELYELELTTTVIEQEKPRQGSNIPYYYSYGYNTKMQIRTGNGCYFDNARRAPESITRTEIMNKTLIFPNPVSKGEVNVKLPTGFEQATVEISDMQGKLVKKLKVNQNTQTLKTDNLQNGVYMLNVITSDFTTKQKIVIAN